MTHVMCSLSKKKFYFNTLSFFYYVFTQTLLCKFCIICPWWQSWKNYSNQRIFIFQYPPSDIWNSLNLPRSYRQKGLKILRNVKTQWISMWEPLKSVLVKYKTLNVTR